MTTSVRIFGMHKAGTSFLMKALSHFCHRNSVALASAPFGLLPLQAFACWDEKMDQRALDSFLSFDPSLKKRIQDFSASDIHPTDSIRDRLDKSELFSIGDTSFEKRLLFYRNSSVPVWKLDKSPAIRVIRNPLSIVKSAYFSHLKTHSTVGWSRLEQQRKRLNSVSRDKGMWLTYEFLREELFFHMTEGPLRTLLSWPDDCEIDTVRMEDITISPSSFLLKVWRMLGGKMEDLRFVPPEILTFEHQSGGRKLGDVDDDNHMRSGDPEEWRELLPDDLIRQIRADYSDIIAKYYPTAMDEHSRTAQTFIAPRETLTELEHVYTTLLNTRKELSTKERFVSNLENRISVVLEQRDQAISSLTTQLQNMKEQRDNAITKYTDQLKRQNLTQKQKDQAISSLTARLQKMKVQRDNADTNYSDQLLRQKDILRQRDEAVTSLNTQFQFMKEQFKRTIESYGDKLERCEEELKRRDETILSLSSQLQHLEEQRNSAAAAESDQLLPQN